MPSVNNVPFYPRYGYDIEVVIGTMFISTALKAGENGLCDTLTISRQENTASSATFSFIPPEGLVDLDDLQNSDVTIFFRTAAGWEQVFQGVVDTPTIDFIARKVTVKCTDDRANQIIQLDHSAISLIGTYDEAVFGQPSDQNDELSKRLETIPASFDFDRFGNYSLTAWAPKTVPDIAMTSADVLQGTNPAISYTSRKTAINTINITVTYNYSRLHQQSCNFVWSGYQDFLADWYGQGKPSFPQRSMIASAATTSNWRLINPANVDNFTPVWPAQGFTVRNPSTGAVGVILWQPNTVTNTYIGKTEQTGYLKDALGQYITTGDPPTKVPIIVPVMGPVLHTGDVPKQVMIVASSTITDTSSTLCRAAQWTSCIKFSQPVSEVYNISVVAPQAVSQRGTINSTATYNVSDPYDTSTWSTSDVSANVNVNFYSDKTPNRAGLVNALQVAYQRARHDILQVYRDTQVQWVTPKLKPTVDLTQTISINVKDPKSTTAHITAKGKVSGVQHDINFNLETARTTITISLSRMAGSAIEDPYAYNVPIQDPSYIGSPQTISLGTHVGIDPNPQVTAGADKWTGYIGNRQEVNSVNRTNYPEQFVVDYPAMPTLLQEPISYTADTVLNIAIPNDDLEAST